MSLKFNRDTKEMLTRVKKPYLSIVIKEEDSAPVVYFEGKRCKPLRALDFNWATADDKGYGKAHLEIKYMGTSKFGHTTDRIVRTKEGRRYEG